MVSSTGSTASPTPAIIAPGTSGQHIYFDASRALQNLSNTFKK